MSIANTHYEFKEDNMKNKNKNKELSDNVYRNNTNMHKKLYNHRKPFNIKYTKPSNPHEIDITHKDIYKFIKNMELYKSEPQYYNCFISKESSGISIPYECDNYPLYHFDESFSERIYQHQNNSYSIKYIAHMQYEHNARVNKMK
jgi:hypothetical protein